MQQTNTSGMGKASAVPAEIKGWSWGAFLLNWVWGIGNSTYIALLMFVPLVNLGVLFVLGAKGNEWAWRNRVWRDVEHFKSTQKMWRNAGLILWLVVLPLLTLPFMGLMKGEAYKASLKQLRASPQVQALVGDDIQPGFLVAGEIAYSGNSGTAELNYSIEGSEGSAEVYLYAISTNDRWTLVELVVEKEDTEESVYVITAPGRSLE